MMGDGGSVVGSWGYSFGADLRSHRCLTAFAPIEGEVCGRGQLEAELDYAATKALALSLSGVGRPKIMTSTSAIHFLPLRHISETVAA